MKTFLFIIPSFLFAATHSSELIQEISTHSKAYQYLEELVAIGPRLSGSMGNQNAVQWSKETFEKLGLDRVYLQPIQIPAWNRGNVEEVTIVNSSEALRAAMLGNSVGTDGNPLEAKVIEVKSIDEVQELGSKISGKIVFFNGAMDTNKNPFAAYSQAVPQRTQGASIAAKYGAVAVLVRSITTLINDSPHTGIVSYNSNIKKIPAFALSTKAAERLSSLLKKNASIKVRLNSNAKQLPFVNSYNVIGEIKGKLEPEKIIDIGGHLDSWDLSPSAHDDGAGIAQTLEIARAFKALKIIPKKTLRFVLFNAEEFGGYGGEEYAKEAARLHENHIAAMESDSGGFQAQGFSTDRGPGFKKIQNLMGLLIPIGANYLEEGGGGTDVGPLRALGTQTIGLIPDATHYFDYHHSELDQIQNVVPSELDSGAKAMAVLADGISEEW